MPDRISIIGLCTGAADGADQGINRARRPRSFIGVVGVRGSTEASFGAFEWSVRFSPSWSYPLLPLRADDESKLFSRGLDESMHRMVQAGAGVVVHRVRQHRPGLSRVFVGDCAARSASTPRKVGSLLPTTTPNSRGRIGRRVRVGTFPHSAGEGAGGRMGRPGGMRRQSVGCSAARTTYKVSIRGTGRVSQARMRRCCEEVTQCWPCSHVCVRAMSARSRRASSVGRMRRCR